MPEINELNLKRLLEHAHIGVVIHHWDTSIVYANPTALRLLRLSYEQIIGKDSFDKQWCFLDEAGKKLFVEDYPVNKVQQTQKRLENEVIGVTDSSRNDISWFMVNAYYEGDDGNSNRYIVVTFTDISDSKRLFSFQDIVENTQDVIIVTEANNISYPLGPKIVYVNQAFEKLTGYSQKDILGETPQLLQGTLTNKEAKNRIHTALTKHQPITETLLNYNSSGRPYWIEMSIIPLKNKYHEVTHFAAIERDVSERKFHLEKRNQDLRALKSNLEQLIEQRTLDLQKAKAQLEKIAFFDPLTNMPNRRFFIDQATKLIKSCNRKNLLVAFGLLDIDDFKLINDSYGHDVGDAVLKEYAAFFNRFFRNDDAFCRYGGEEFAIAVAINDAGDAEGIGKRIIAEVQQIGIKLTPEKIIQSTASLGIKVCSADRELDFEDQIKKADLALYQAKNEGKNKYVIIFE